MPTCKYPRKAYEFIGVLSSAACEWILIFLMLLSAILNHFLLEFARYCELEMPCPLCSRLDGCFGSKGLELFSDILCSSHRVEISYLMSCYIHGKLVDVRELCEDCLSSSTLQDSLNSLPVGKLGLGIGYSGFRNSYQKTTPGSPCKCCMRLRKSMASIKDQPWKKSLAGSSKLDVSTSRGCPNRRNELKKMRNIVSRSASCNQRRRKLFDPLSYVSYSELKRCSDSEAEFPTFDSDDDNGARRGNFIVQRPFKGIYRRSETSLPSKQRNPSQSAAHSLLDLNGLPKDPEPLPDVAIWHSLRGLNWKPNELKSTFRSVSSLGIPSSSSVLDVCNKKEKLDLSAPDPAPDSSIDFSQKSAEEMIESGQEPLDDNAVCGDVGDSVVDRLRKQVEHDERCINELYKELEEERNASAVAANQAMAMINRLQEEKATLHMEALQYLRMMEEQAEYDVEALEKANDLLVDKDKEIQDLESELEIYRIRFAEESACVKEFN